MTVKQIRELETLGVHEIPADLYPDGWLDERGRVNVNECAVWADVLGSKHSGLNAIPLFVGQDFAPYPNGCTPQTKGHKHKSVRGSFGRVRVYHSPKWTTEVFDSMMNGLGTSEQIPF